jgi:hypothetical protein
VLSIPDEKVEVVKFSHSIARSFSTFDRSMGLTWVGNFRKVCGSKVQVILKICAHYVRQIPTFNAQSPLFVVGLTLESEGIRWQLKLPSYFEDFVEVRLLFNIVQLNLDFN